MSHPLRGFLITWHPCHEAPLFPGVRLFLPAGRLRPPAAGFPQQRIGKFCRDFSREIDWWRILPGGLLPQIVLQHVCGLVFGCPPSTQDARSGPFSISREGGRHSFTGIATKTAAAGIHCLEAIFHLDRFSTSSGLFNSGPVLVLPQWVRQAFPWISRTAPRPSGDYPPASKKPYWRSLSTLCGSVLAWANIAVPVWTRIFSLA